QGRMVKPCGPSARHHGRLGHETTKGRDRKDEACDDGGASGGLLAGCAHAVSLKKRQSESHDSSCELKPAQADDGQIDRHFSGR
ncbi:MAG: hypothetical protein ACI8U3_003053, partial [Brevundimonas sp.]